MFSVKKVKNKHSVILSSFILLETRHFHLIVLKTVQSQEEVKHTERLCCWRFRQTSETSREHWRREEGYQHTQRDKQVYKMRDRTDNRGFSVSAIWRNQVKNSRAFPEAQSDISLGYYSV